MPRADAQPVSQANYRFPTWWFIFMVVQNFPNMILEGCLWGVIWPQAIGDIFGSTEKTKVLGLLTSVQTSTQIFSPVVGDLADKMPESCSKYFGRRRPFVLFGHLMYCGGFVFSYFGLYKKREELMICGQLLIGFSGMMQGPNFMALNAETIPVEQRTLMGAVQNTVAPIGNLLSNCLGILVGEGWVNHHMGIGKAPFRDQDGDRTIWYLVMCWKFLMIPFMLMQFNSRAGCWHPEVQKPVGQDEDAQPADSTTGVVSSSDYRKGLGGRPETRSFIVRNEHSKWLRYNNPATGSAYYCNEELGVCSVTPPKEGILADAAPAFSDFATRFSAVMLRAQGQAGWCDRVLARLRNFFSAFFDESAFRWFYVVSVIGTISGQFMGPFFFYFLQDCFPHGYVLFGWTITKSTQSMVSIFGMMGSVIQGTTSWTSKYLSERFGARQMQIYSNGGPGTPFGGLVNQFEPFTYAIFPGVFPLLFFWQVHDALMGGFGAAAGYTLQFDVLPVGPDGRPKSAARDMSVQATASIVPNMVMPAVLGWWLTKFSSHYLGFRYFYGIGGSVGLLANLLFCTNVHPLEEPLDLACQCTRHSFDGRAEHDMKRRAKLKSEARAGQEQEARLLDLSADVSGVESEIMETYLSGSNSYKQQGNRGRGGSLGQPLLRSV